MEQAKAAKHLVVTCETLCDNGELKKESNQNQIPFIHVDAVVHVPNGAFPTACYMHYDYDPQYLHMYADHAKDDDMYQAYLDRYIFTPQNPWRPGGAHGGGSDGTVNGRSANRLCRQS